MNHYYNDVVRFYLAEHRKPVNRCEHAKKTIEIKWRYISLILQETQNVSYFKKYHVENFYKNRKLVFVCRPALIVFRFAKIHWLHR